MSFGNRIKIHRKNKRISQEELAKKIGVHANHISRYERNITKPSIEVAAKIAKSLGVSIDSLAFDNQININSIKNKELIELFKKVNQFSEKNKQVVIDLLSAFVLKHHLIDKLK